MASRCETRAAVESLLGQLDDLCKQLGDAFARHTLEQDAILSDRSIDSRSGRSVVEKEVCDNEIMPLKSLDLEDLPAEYDCDEIMPLETSPGFDSTEVYTYSNKAPAKKESSTSLPVKKEASSSFPSERFTVLTGVVPPPPGTVQRPEEEETHVHVHASDAETRTTWNTSPWGRKTSCGAFVVREAYVKTEAELARLMKRENKSIAETPRASRHKSLTKALSKALNTANTLCAMLPFTPSFNMRNIIREPTSSTTKRNWDMIGCLLLAFDVFFIPLGLSFDLPRHPSLTILEICGIVYWSLDMGMTLTTGYYKGGDDQEPVMDFHKIVRRYVFSRHFAFDILLVSIDWIIFIVSGVEDLSVALLARMVRVARVLRLLKLLRVSKASSFRENLRRWLVVAINREVLYFLSDIVKIVCTLVLVSHYMVCIYYYIGKAERGWLSRHPDLEQEKFAKRYFISVTLMSRRANSYTRGVEMDMLTDVEKVFDVLALGVFNGFIAWVTSTVTNNMMEVNRRKRERNERIDYIRNYYLVQHPRIDDRVKLQLLKFMDRGYNEYRAAQQRNKNEEELLKALPMQLAKDFRREAWQPVLGRHKLFQIFHGSAIEDICMLAVFETFCRTNELVFKSRGVGARMLFVFKGLLGYGCIKLSLPVLEQGGAMPLASFLQDIDHKEVTKGSWLCEPVLWTTSWQHRGSLIAKESCIFCEVSSHELEKVLKAHESALHDVVRYAVTFVKHLNRKELDRLSDLSDDVMESAYESVKEYLLD